MRQPFIDLSRIDGALATDGGLSRPQWHVIWNWIEASVPEVERHEAYVQIARQWLEQVAGELGDGYVVYESPVLFLVTAHDEPSALRLIRHCERVLSHVASTLTRVVQRTGYGKRVALLFDSHDHYYTYIAHHYPDGEYATSGGCCITDGYRHVAVNGSADWAVAETLTHELSHVSLMSANLPIWLEEGVVQIIEAALHPSRGLALTRELVQRHRDYWTRHGLGGFWTGESFHRTDDGQELSYNLAHVLAQNLLGERRVDFQKFLLDVDAEDHGALALKTHFGLSLADCVATFLGDGPWLTASRV